MTVTPTRACISVTQIRGAAAHTHDEILEPSPKKAALTMS